MISEIIGAYIPWIIIFSLALWVGIVIGLTIVVIRTAGRGVKNEPNL